MKILLLLFASLTRTEACGGNASCVCPSGTYLDPSTGACIDCAATWEAPNAGGTDCSEPGIKLSTLPVMPGYWRESREARIVRRCPGQANCLGGAGDASCANGSTGILCSTCWHPVEWDIRLENHTQTYIKSYGSLSYKANNSHGGRHYKLGERKPSVPCAPCAEVDLKRLQYSLLSATLLLPVILAALWSCRAKLRALPICVKLGCGVGGAAVRHARSMIPRLKILISTLQILNCWVLGGVIELTPVFSRLLQFMGTITFLNTFDLLSWWGELDCVFPSDYWGELSFKTITPLGLVLLCKAARGCLPGSGQQRIAAQKSRGNRAEALGFAILYLAYPSAMAAVFAYFVCGQLSGPGESGSMYLLADYRIDCQTPWYLSSWKAYVLTMLGIWPLGVPFYCVSMLWAERKTLRELATLDGSARRGWPCGRQRRTTPDAQRCAALEEEKSTRVRILTSDYTRACYWYELIEFSRKICMIGFGGVSPPGSAAQKALLLAMAVVFAIWTLCWRPYRQAYDTTLAMLCQVFLIGFLGSGLFYEHVRRDDASQQLVDWLRCVLWVAVWVVALVIESRTRLDDDVPSVAHGEEPRSSSSTLAPRAVTLKADGKGATADEADVHA